MIVWQPKTLLLSGGLVLLLGAGAELYKLNTELKYGNLGSDPNWVRPTPTLFDAFVLRFPAGVLVTVAIALLTIGLVQRFSGRSK